MALKAIQGCVGFEGLGFRVLGFQVLGLGVAGFWVERLGAKGLDGE